MSLPVRLTKGLVSIYHVTDHIGSLRAPANYNFGIIENTWYNDAYPPFIGSQIMFDGRDVISLVYGGIKYTIAEEEKIKLISISSP